jgi:thiol-disulfide isomerase/thioredoxin
MRSALMKMMTMRALTTWKTALAVVAKRARGVAVTGLLSLSLSLAPSCAGAPAPVVPPVKVAALNAGPGAMVDIEKSIPLGFVTVVDFWADYCAACKTVEAELLAGIADAPDIVVRKVDVGAGDSDVAKAYKIGGLPHLRIFDRRGRLRYMLVGDDAHQAAAAAKKLSKEK